MSEVPPTVVAGAVAGSVALLAFVAIHAVWIVPIWAMLWMLPLAALIGALAAWPFNELVAHASLPPVPFDGVAFSGLLLVTLVPTALAGLLVGPLDRDHISVPALLLPLLLAAPAGGAIGALLTGSAGGSAALAIAAVVLALTLGHNLPFFPIGSAAWGKAFGLVVGVEVAAGIVFSTIRAMMAVAATGLAPR